MIRTDERTTRRPGDLLREWRQHRRMSQLELALDAEVSTRHLSFVETGRAQPSREMILRLAERLEIPLRERNTLLAAAGFAPAFTENALAEPALEIARRAIDLVLSGHEPYPALAIDRYWNLIASNSAVAPLLAGADAALLRPPVNVLRLSLHPDGIAPRIANLRQWRSHLLARLRHQIDATADQALAALLRELNGYPLPDGNTPFARAEADGDYGSIAVPLRLITDAGVLSFISTTTVFGTPADVTLSEIAIEAFFPADLDTAAALRRLAEPRVSPGVLPTK